MKMSDNILKYPHFSRNYFENASYNLFQLKRFLLIFWRQSFKVFESKWLMFIFCKYTFISLDGNNIDLLQFRYERQWNPISYMQDDKITSNQISLSVCGVSCSIAPASVESSHQSYQKWLQRHKRNNRTNNDKITTYWTN